MCDVVVLACGKAGGVWWRLQLCALEHGASLSPPPPLPPPQGHIPAGLPLQKPSILALRRTSHTVMSSLPAAASSSGRDACSARAEHRREVEPSSS
eukprot:scaffold3745_cov79-Isochrysis_galbana.AAC.1